MHMNSYQELEAAAGGLALLPVGCTEEHGPVLPLETDSVIAAHCCTMTRERLEHKGFKVRVVHAIKGVAFESWPRVLTDGQRRGRASSEACPGDRRLWIYLLLLCLAHAAGAQEPRLTRIATDAGRLSVHDRRLAFDAATARGAAEVYVMDLTGATRRCVTDGLPFERRTGDRFVGQPAWHPDGKHLLIQVESRHSLRHPLFNHPAWGLDNDLWLIALDGSRAEKIYTPRLRGAALHAHFDKLGDRLLFAERRPTGQKLEKPLLRSLAYDGENQWEGWQLHTARVDISQSGASILSHHKVLRPNGSGFYQATGFDAQGNLLYDHTPGGLPYVAANYRCSPDGSSLTTLNDAPGHWDEHGLLSAQGLSFMSSRADTDWNGPKTGARNLRTELYLKRPSGRVVQVTHFNQQSPQSVISDMEWDATGSRLFFLRTVVQGLDRTSPEIWMADFGGD